MKPTKHNSHLVSPDWQGRNPFTDAQLDALTGLDLAHVVLRWVYRIPPQRAIAEDGTYIPHAVCRCIRRDVVREVDHLESLTNTVDTLTAVLVFGDQTFYHRYEPDGPKDSDFPWVWNQRIGKPWQSLIEQAVADYEYWKDEDLDFSTLSMLEQLTHAMNTRGFHCKLEQIPEWKKWECIWWSSTRHQGSGYSHENPGYAAARAAVRVASKYGSDWPLIERELQQAAPRSYP